jgi:hypothetical protein
VENPGVHDTRTYFGGGTALVLKTRVMYRVEKGGACTRVATPSLNDRCLPRDLLLTNDVTTLLCDAIASYVDIMGFLVRGGGILVHVQTRRSSDL